ncbi:MAG: hypothetical protein JNM93_09155 [Bacteriovoracaceae bacterium]|nr:hypothetical protein [Bacteriovoracaceae bacterium]
MSFDDFSSSFVKENRKLKMALAISLIIFSIGTISLLAEKRYYLYQGGEIFDERPLAEEVCRQAFMTLAQGSPNPFVVSSEIIELVNKEPFSLTVDKILQIKSLEIGACKIILKSEGQLLAFKVILEGRDTNPFFYKLTELNEIPPKEEL